MSKSFFY